MMKYIVCILLGAFLLLGLHSVSNKDRQESRTKTGTTLNLQYHPGSYYSESEVVSQQSCKETRTVNNEGYNCKNSNAILGNSLSSRTLPPSKTLKLNPTIIALQVLRSLNSQFPYQNRTSLSAYTNLTKYSHRYYIYTLRRILI